MRVNLTQGKENGNNGPNKMQTTPTLGPSSVGWSLAGASPAWLWAGALPWHRGGFPFSPTQNILEGLLKCFAT